MKPGGWAEVQWMCLHSSPANMRVIGDETMPERFFKVWWNFRIPKGGVLFLAGALRSWEAAFVLGFLL